MKKCVWGFAFCVFLSACNEVNDQPLENERVDIEEPEPFDTQALEEIFLAHPPANGALGVSVVVDGRVVYTHTQGVENAMDTRPDETTLFSVGSLSKMLTGYSLVALADQGALDLNDAVSQSVPELSLNGGEADDVKVIDLLAHRSGIGSSNFNYYGSLEGFFAGPNVDAWVAADRLFSYSNVGYNLAGLVAARVNQSTYAEALAETTLTDFAFYDATANRLEATRAKHAQGFYDDQWIRPSDHDDFSMPSGGVWMSSRDLGLLLLHMLKISEDNDVQRRLDLWLRPLSATRSSAGQSYASGLFLNDGLVPTTIEHSGSISAYQSNVTVVPTMNLGVALVSSSLDSRCVDGPLRGRLYQRRYLAAAIARPQCCSWRI